MTVQVVSQVARASSSELPTLMRTVYSAVALIQLEGIVIAPACLGTYAFQSEVGLMGAALLCWTAAIVTYYACQCRCCGSFAYCRQGQHDRCAPPRTDCDRKGRRARQLPVRHDGGGSASRLSTARRLCTAPRSQAPQTQYRFRCSRQTRTTCASRASTPLRASLAIVCLVVYAMGLPLLTSSSGSGATWLPASARSPCPARRSPEA